MERLVKTNSIKETQDSKENQDTDKDLGKNKNILKELVLFFSLSFIISWVIWFLAPIIANGDMLLFYLICFNGVFGPSISAMIITSKIDSSVKVKTTRKKLRAFAVIFIITFCIISFPFLLSWGLLIFSFPYLINLIISALITTYIISGKNSSQKGLSELLKTIMGIKGKNIHVLFAFLMPIGIYLGILLIFLILGGTFSPTIALILFLLQCIIFLPNLLHESGFNEELGWRGFATPRLQKRFSPMMTGLIIGIIWSIWHAPWHFNGFYGDGWVGFLTRFIYNIPFGIIFTWYYNRSRQNLLGCAVLHTSFNVYQAILVIPELEGFIYFTLMLIVISFIVIVRGKMWKKIPFNSEAKVKESKQI